VVVVMVAATRVVVMAVTRGVVMAVTRVVMVAPARGVMVAVTRVVMVAPARGVMVAVTRAVMVAPARVMVVMASARSWRNGAVGPCDRVVIEADLAVARQHATVDGGAGLYRD
jgi:hypothetical protein